MAGITYLDLPKINPELEQQLIDVGMDMPNWPEASNYETKLHGSPHITNSNTDNWSTSGNWEHRSKPSLMPDHMVDALREQFQPYFKHEIFPTLIKFNNNTGQDKGNCGPHCDVWRSIGLNYHLQLGGDNVITCTYAQTRKDWSNILTNGENLTYDQVDLLCEHHVPARSWHVLDVQRFHAVHNVEHDRILVSLAYGVQIPYRDFLKQHSDLII